MNMHIQKWDTNLRPCFRFFWYISRTRITGSTLFSTVAAPFYFPTNKYTGLRIFKRRLMWKFCSKIQIYGFSEKSEDLLSLSLSFSMATISCSQVATTPVDGSCDLWFTTNPLLYCYLITILLCSFLLPAWPLYEADFLISGVKDTAREKGTGFWLCYLMVWPQRSH